MKKVPRATQGKRLAIGKRMQQARETAGMSQQTLAAYLSTPQSFVAKMESGVLAVRVKDYLEFCAAVDADPCDLAHDVFEHGPPISVELPPYLLLEEYVGLSRLLKLDAYKNLERLAELQPACRLGKVRSTKRVRVRQLRNDWLRMKLPMPLIAESNQRWSNRGG